MNGLVLPLAYRPDVTAITFDRLTHTSDYLEAITAAVAELRRAGPHYPTECASITFDMLRLSEELLDRYEAAE